MHPQLVPHLAPLPRATGRARPTGLVPGTPVETDEGPVPVEYLLAGDRVLTRNGPVELRGTSALQALDADVVIFEPGSALTAGPGGLSVPLVLPADQQVLLRDWRALVLHGQPQMLTPAASLVDDVYIRRGTRAALRLIRLHFDTPQVLRAGGLDLASARTRAPLEGAERWLH